VGQVEFLDTSDAIAHWKARGFDLAPILHAPAEPDEPRRNVTGQDHGLEKALDNTLIALAEGALSAGTPVQFEIPIRNVNRTVGTMLGHEVTKRHRGAGLPDNTIDITFTGSAGQSFGAFVPRGVTLRLVGDANDYVGKGLSGGRIIVRPPETSSFAAHRNVIAGNVLLYGATAGEAFIRGVVGERFCVRNSGASAVVEGVGDHGCEYMTGGVVVVLGTTGRNFAAGMSGGVAYLLDLDARRVNTEMVEIEPLDAEDMKVVEALVRGHVDETDSSFAAELLVDWSASVDRFTKIMPRDYKRVLAARAKAEHEGLDVNEQIMAASHG
jgi:glutamate synthase (NADPH/NADH) large chain